MSACLPSNGEARIYRIVLDKKLVLPGIRHICSGLFVLSIYQQISKLVVLLWQCNCPKSYA